jgi:hypothetical protein
MANLLKDAAHPVAIAHVLAQIPFFALLDLTTANLDGQPIKVASLAQWAIIALLVRHSRNPATPASFLKAQANRHAAHAPRASLRRLLAQLIALLVAPGTPRQ